MKEEIIEKLKVYFREQGIAFMSEREAFDFYMGLVLLIEDLIEENKHELH